VSLYEFGLLLMAVCASSLGQLLLKLGALQLGKVTAANVVSHVISMATIPAVLGGLLAYGLGAIAYILVLTRVPLSVAAPAAALIYLFSVLAGYLVFKEPLPSSRIVGLGLIICGVMLVSSR